MVDFGTPYAMDNTVIPGAGLRRQLQQSAGPGSGVLRNGDFRITQMNVPGQGVKIAAGDDLVQCRAPGRDRETYGVPLLTDQVYMGDGGTGIPGTGSSAGRRDMIIHEILDPDLPRHYTPRETWPENQFSKLSVVPGVPAGAKRAADVPALNDVTCVALAAINWPASTGTITNNMIEDLRKLHKPETLRRMLLSFPDGALTTGRRTPYGTYGDWPLVGNERPMVDVPEWATKVKVTAYVEGAWYAKGNSNTERFVAGTRMGMGGVFSQNGIITREPTDAGQRSGFAIIGDVPIGPAIRGTRQALILQAATTSSGQTGGLFVDYQSCISIDYEFTGEI